MRHSLPRVQSRSLTSPLFGSTTIYPGGVTEMTLLKIPIAILYLLVLNCPAAYASPRIYYVGDSNAIAKGEGTGFGNSDAFEQSSRDLDLSFSTGDTNYPREDAAVPIFRGINPIRPYDVTQGRQYLEVGRETDHKPPRAYYKLIEIPERRTRLDDVIFEPKQNEKLTRFDGERKGEVILELRVITNNDAV